MGDILKLTPLVAASWLVSGSSGMILKGGHLNKDQSNEFWPQLAVEKIFEHFLSGPTLELYKLIAAILVGRRGHRAGAIGCTSVIPKWDHQRTIPQKLGLN